MILVQGEEETWSDSSPRGSGRHTPAHRQREGVLSPLAEDWKGPPAPRKIHFTQSALPETPTQSHLDSHLTEQPTPGHADTKFTTIQVSGALFVAPKCGLLTPHTWFMEGTHVRVAVDFKHTCKSSDLLFQGVWRAPCVSVVTLTQ